jgi:hypothetical protein
MLHVNEKSISPMLSIAKHGIGLPESSTFVKIPPT